MAIKMAPISRKTHENRFWQRYTSYQFVQKDHLAPLVTAEIPRALLAMPLAFVEVNNVFVLVGILSIVPGQNMFVNPEGKWLGPYVPSCFRSYPFSLARMNGKDGMVLCVDESSGLISEKGGEPFFDEQGELARPVRDILNFLTQVHQSKQATDSAVAALAKAGLMTQWMSKEKNDEKQVAVDGLYKVNEAKLNSLNDESFLTLRKSGGLPIAYAQLLSMGNISLLSRMAERNATASPAPPLPKNMGSMVLDDDMIRFE